MAAGTTAEPLAESAAFSAEQEEDAEEEKEAPPLPWRSFAKDYVQLAKSLGVEVIVRAVEVAAAELAKLPPREQRQQQQQLLTNLAALAESGRLSVEQKAGGGDEAGGD